tara:strand:- start:77 stop:1081 length:1005 start_codon:yes stop_codon:yes gene_type:complete
MKIEIAESLISSYLKHTEGCRFVQTNWMTSGKWIVTDHEKERARLLFERISNSTSFLGIFKKSSFDQLIKQAEIDVLGINTTENTIYAIDVAFHSHGLNYGSKEETAMIVLKKIFRSVFIMQTFFNANEKFNSYFITPKTNPATQVLIDELMIMANEVIDDDLISIKFISNDQFYADIMDPVLTETYNEHDTAELFLRAVKLLKLDSRKAKPVANAITEKIKPRVLGSKRTENGMKIGQFVQHSFRTAFEQNLISTTEIIQLQNPDYSKRTFGSNFEILKKTSRGITDENGRTRYYAREVFCGDYHLSSQWVEPQWDMLLGWLRRINFYYSNEK